PFAHLYTAIPARPLKFAIGPHFELVNALCDYLYKNKIPYETPQAVHRDFVTMIYGQYLNERIDGVWTKERDIVIANPKGTLNLEGSMLV
ncbi:MAG: hypothetical protein ACKOEE_00075, partial [Tagaea sp.]